jgi:hypothetical protein
MSGYDHLFKITVSYSEVTTFIVPFFSLNVVLIYRKKIPDFGKPPLESRRTKYWPTADPNMIFLLLDILRNSISQVHCKWATYHQ